MFFNKTSKNHVGQFSFLHLSKLLLNKSPSTIAFFSSIIMTRMSLTYKYHEFLILA